VLGAGHAWLFAWCTVWQPLATLAGITQLHSNRVWYVAAAHIAFVVTREVEDISL
jgi:hypothetical protein